VAQAEAKLAPTHAGIPAVRVVVVAVQVVVKITALQVVVVVLLVHYLVMVIMVVTLLDNIRQEVAAEVAVAQLLAVVAPPVVIVVVLEVVDLMLAYQMPADPDLSEVAVVSAPLEKVDTYLHHLLQINCFRFQKHLQHKLAAEVVMVLLLRDITERQVGVEPPRPPQATLVVMVAELEAELALEVVIILYLELLNLVAAEGVVLRVVGQPLAYMVLMAAVDTLLLRIHNENSFII
jgi:hypothetical protein